MLKRIFLCLLAVTVAAFCLTSCNTVGSVNELLTAPRADGELYDIQQALYAYAGRSVKLHYPRSGENRTPFIRYDLDGDKIDEAVALYTAANADGVNEIHVNIIDRKDARWVSVCDTATGASGIDKVDISPLSKGGLPVIVIGAELFSSTTDLITLFTYADEHLYTRMKENYTRFLLCDIEKKGYKQLVTLNVNSAERVGEVNIYEVGNDFTTLVGTAPVDGNISSVTAFNFAALSDGRPALYIDSAKNANSYITDLVYFEGEKLVNPFYNKQLGETTATLRYNPLVCTDVDNNGCMDIPFSQLFYGYENSSLSDRLYLTCWRSFDGKNTDDTLVGDFNFDKGYYFAFPSAWVGNVTLIYDEGSNMHSYRLWDSTLNSSSNEIVRIRRYSEAEFDEVKKDDLIELVRSDNQVWAARLIMHEGKYALDKETVKAAFGIL